MFVSKYSIRLDFDDLGPMYEGAAFWMMHRTRGFKPYDSSRRTCDKILYHI